MSSRRSQFNSQFPRATYLEADHLDALEPLLRSVDLLAPEESVVRTEKPGEGNMNFVLRVITTKRSFILKQSRPWVEKYPQIAAPVERLEAEAAYYRVIAADPDLRAMSPTLLALESTHLIMVTEDLGRASDLTSIFTKGAELPVADIHALFDYLGRLHVTSNDIDPAAFPPNQKLKELNHAHIFDLPFRRDNGFDLDATQPGLNALAQPVVGNDGLRTRLTELGQFYLGSGPVLIHGDFYPGSWLRTDDGLKVIDPEFAFFGQAEFDMGVMIAHLLMARIPLETIKTCLPAYLQHGSIDETLVIEFAGAEILRRLLGLAQLPVDLDLVEKSKLIELAQRFINEPSSTAFC